MNFLLDTNILVIYSRDSEIANKIEVDHQLFSGGHNLAISIVSIGELDSLIKQNKYGVKRKNKINKILNQLFEIDINIRKIIDAYGSIDAFSQGKLEEKSLEMTSRNMGKNDLWIAATAHAFDMVLVTTDKDFQHLDNSFIKLKYIDISKYVKKKN